MLRDPKMRGYPNTADFPATQLWSVWQRFVTVLPGLPQQ